MAQKINFTGGWLKALLLSPVVLLFASAVRLLIISNYDVATATTIASSGGFVNTLLGTTIPLLPPFLPALTILLTIVRKYAFAALAAGATVVVSPAYAKLTDAWDTTWESANDVPALLQGQEWHTIWVDYRWATIAGGASLVLAFWDPPTRPIGPFNEWVKDTKKRPDKFFKFILLWGPLRLIVVVAIVVGATCVCMLAQSLYNIPRGSDTAAQIVRRPWMPLEKVEVGMDPPRIGYTIATKDGWHTFLREKDRTIEILKANKVRSRTICVLPTPGGGGQPYPANTRRYPLLGIAGVRYVDRPSCLA
ncbi:hypothetical protein [Asanoa hainanensis]|uniref:hypothetical protein n=1 Tax=Asanoa hainanensis TaxID=560556 RepID=UPI00117EE5CF|nr:hypothetical protein [Asanoa hainanensis]